MATIVTFATSLFIASFLVVFKVIELKYQKRNFLLKLLGNADGLADKLVAKLKFRSLQLIQIIRYIVFVRIKKSLSDNFMNLKETAVKEYRMSQDIVMGRKKIQTKGSVSFYLKKITEDKNGAEKGKIEDRLDIMPE